MSSSGGLSPGGLSPDGLSPGPALSCRAEAARDLW